MNLVETAIANRLAEVRERIRVAARRSGRDENSVLLLLASKAQTTDSIRAAHAAGVRDFGENYVQEATAKHAALSDLGDIRWHLIGHLQTNKVRLACRIFDIIHTVNSTRLSAAIAREKPEAGVLIEVNLGVEKSKTGAAADEVEELIELARGQLVVRGLMTIPPPASDPEESRAFFARLREMRDRLATHSGLALSDLSMGMSDDFEVAIEEGATIVRIGRMVFGERIK